MLRDLLHYRGRGLGGWNGTVWLRLSASMRASLVGRNEQKVIRGDHKILLRVVPVPLMNEFVR